MATLIQRVSTLAKRKGVLRSRDLDHAGIPRVHLGRATAQGLVVRVGRGLYIPAEADITEKHSLAEAARRVPNGVLCLLTALQFHGLTTQLPYQVWVAIDPKARLPKPASPPLRIVRFSGVALTFGVEHHMIENVPVRIFSPAKTVADCFKYRNKIGLDVAIEALRDCLRQRKATRDALADAAKACRVSAVMRPYLEALS
jgi:predicted transcriptional regulator of viral defense system